MLIPGMNGEQLASQEELLRLHNATGKWLVANTAVIENEQTDLTRQLIEAEIMDPSGGAYHSIIISGKRILEHKHLAEVAEQLGIKNESSITIDYAPAEPSATDFAIKKAADSRVSDETFSIFDEPGGKLKTTREKVFRHVLNILGVYSSPIQNSENDMTRVECAALLQVVESLDVLVPQLESVASVQ